MKGTEDAYQSSGNIFADLELADAQELHLKSSLVIELRRQIEGRQLTQTAAAKILGMGQADLSKLLRGGLRGTSVERLMRMLTAFDQDVEITVRPHSRAGGGGRITVTPVPA
ncbi:transcriptional regulator, XRE family [Methylorubrum populi BJ001]|jgi:predicted XRE-type DNA-binding protein|uniref:Transcriptional regulator, XRE family n=1 Tax=Methylorubrum populi (strain ATCC BAA-705 / NCIMB 13946 / BJ001) TaxID=441620 RepID=B1Z7X3_METPB|nr:helix-turn-helix transcriptional regulator [Methylorubrum populi]ACB78944.1 transcriptional regulator, XRE family [Methylorubrum populi BJ001]OAH32351.1 XRE family transcriptional regulator [Methylorubrum populi]PZP71361.1 MAG: XRE family transcriptional regulator [Methylorubrum populi]